MPRDQKSGKPTTRRYSDHEKAQAVRLVRQLRDELGASHGTVQQRAFRQAKRDALPDKGTMTR
jgi:transposase-like protein